MGDDENYPFGDDYDDPGPDEDDDDYDEDYDDNYQRRLGDSPRGPNEGLLEVRQVSEDGLYGETCQSLEGPPR